MIVQSLYISRTGRKHKQVVLDAVSGFAGAAGGCEAAATVAEGTITSGVVNREPVDHLQALAAGATHVYCFTRITDAADGGFVVPTWY